MQTHLKWLRWTYWMWPIWHYRGEMAMHLFTIWDQNQLPLGGRTVVIGAFLEFLIHGMSLYLQFTWSSSPFNQGVLLYPLKLRCDWWVLCGWWCLVKGKMLTRNGFAQLAYKPIVVGKSFLLQAFNASSEQKRYTISGREYSLFLALAPFIYQWMLNLSSGVFLKPLLLGDCLVG